MDGNLLPGLLNTALRNSGESLDELVLTHDIEKPALEERMTALGYRYNADTNQFRPVASQPSEQG